jgi:hypothetical protein
MAGSKGSGLFASGSTITENVGLLLAFNVAAFSPNRAPHPPPWAPYPLVPILNGARRLVITSFPSGLKQVAPRSLADRATCSTDGGPGSLKRKATVRDYLGGNSRLRQTHLSNGSSCC